MTYPEDIMAAARQLYIALAKTEFQTGLLPKGEAACRAGEYDGDQEMQIIAAAIAAERARNTWQPIETAPSMQTVLISFESSFGKGRTIRAVYAPEKTWEDTSYDGDFSKYDEKNDAYYYPSGWYEDLYNAVDDVGFHYLGADFAPTHWMPLPQPPKGE